jgi:N,N'-diacetyllegionaminate synthase
MSVRPLRIGKRLIGGEQPCFVIAEAGVNHNGDPDMARKLVDVAAAAGADAVKFQTFDPEKLVTASAPKAAYQQRNDGNTRSQREMLEALVLPRALHAELRTRAESKGMMFLSSPFDEDAADFLAALGVPALKIPSGELTNHLLLAHLAAKKLPLLMSTGMATLDEIAAALSALQVAGSRDVALFHCVSNYPCSPEEANLRAMATMRERFGLPVGWSDHTLGIDVSLAAVAMGAELLEKHFTLDRGLPGPDHKASLEPGELHALVRGVRNVEAARGSGQKHPTASESAVALVARRSLHYRADRPAGHVLTRNDLQALRPGDGISPARVNELVGRVLTKAVNAGSRLTLADLETSPTEPKPEVTEVNS